MPDQNRGLPGNPLTVNLNLRLPCCSKTHRAAGLRHRPRRVIAPRLVVVCVTRAIAGGSLFQNDPIITYRRAGEGPDELMTVVQPCVGRTRRYLMLCPHHRHLSARVRAFVTGFRPAVTGR